MRNGKLAQIPGDQHDSPFFFEIPRAGLMDLVTLLDIAQGVAALLAMLATGIGVVWVFFRTKIREWWAPYKAGIEGMGELPSMRVEINEGRGEIAVLGQRMGMLDLVVRARGDINIETGEFECNEAGENTYVNQTFARWIGVGKEELMHHNWINFVAREERDGVRKEWAQCREEHRIYNRRVTFITVDGDALVVDVIATPIPEIKPAKKWIGVLRRVV